MRSRIVLIAALVAVYAGSLRFTGQAPGGLGAQGGRSAARSWAQDAAMKITEPFTLAKLSEPFGTTITVEGNVGVIRPSARIPSSRP